jgi:predicted CXXCH cytochrome family protein
VRKFPLLDRLVSANVEPSEPGLHPFKPYAIATVNGERIGAKPLKVGFVGVTESGAAAMSAGGKAFLAGYRITDPIEAARKYVPELRRSCDLVVVLAYLDRESAKRLGSEVPGIDVILAARQHPPYSTVDEAGDAIVGYVSNQTKWLGELRLYKSADPKNGSISNYIHRNVPLDEGVPDDQAAQKIASAAREEFTKVQQASAAASSSAALDRQKAFLANQSPFTGAESCAACHKAEFGIWKASKHAHAMHTLEEKGRQFDASCTQCHSVGQSVPGGFRTVTLTPQLANVQCESCHTAGKPHAAKPAAGYGRMATPDVCLTCHTKENSPSFDFAKYWEKIKHGKGVAAPVAAPDHAVR